MRSSTFSFRGIGAFRGLAIAIAVASVFEFASYALQDYMPPAFRSNFLAFSYLKPENGTKIGQEMKFSVLPDLQPEFVQVGDSSGTQAIIVNDIMAKYIGKEHSYVSLNCCADEGYRGHRYVAERAAQIDPAMRYLVLYVTPFAPVSYYGDVGPILANSINDTFLGIRHNFMPVSLGWRLYLVNAILYRKFSSDLLVNPVNRHEEYHQGQAPLAVRWKKGFEEARGYSVRRYEDRAKDHPPPSGVCDFPLAFEKGADGREKSADMVKELSDTAAFARANRLRMILVFNAVSCIPGDTPHIRELERRVEEFKRENPDVLVPFAFIHTVPQEDFLDWFHVNEEGAQITTRMLGEYLRNKLASGELKPLK